MARIPKQTITLIVGICLGATIGMHMRTAQGAAPNPCATPTTAPIPAGARAHVTLGKFRDMRSQFGDIRVVGFVTNDGAAPASDIEVAVSLIDNKGKTVGAESAIYTRDVLPSKQRSPFLALISPAPKSYAKVQIQVHYATFDPTSFSAQVTPQAAGLSTFNETRIGPDSNGILTITGQVRNAGRLPAKLVEIIGILYDSTDTPVDVGDTFTKLDTLAPGETAPFSLDFSPTKGVARYALYVQGEAVTK